VVAIGKRLGSGFPATCLVERQPRKHGLEEFSVSSSYGGNPLVSAAALASIQIFPENLLDYRQELGDH
jgi:acetylornithine/succinyldiaminopimelate/putrescine aminotransferase